MAAGKEAILPRLATRCDIKIVDGAVLGIPPPAAVSVCVVEPESGTVAQNRSLSRLQKKKTSGMPRSEVFSPSRVKTLLREEKQGGGTEPELRFTLSVIRSSGVQ